MAADYVFELERVSKSYPRDWLGRRRLTALREVTLRAARGDTLGLIGPNRAGKTTLVKLLLSLCTADAGQTRRFGRPGRDRETLGRIGYVHEHPAFPRYLTATQLLHFYGALSLLPEAVVRRRTGDLLARVGLADRSHEAIARMSKGMVQRLALAQALVNDPELLILDEPTEGLDLEGRQLLHSIVQEARAAGRTVLLISHLLADVEELCDRAVVLRAGRVVYDGAMADLTRDAASGSRCSLSDAAWRYYADDPSLRPVEDDRAKR